MKIEVIRILAHMSTGVSDDEKGEKTFEPVFMSPGGSFVKPSVPALNLTPDTSLAVFNEAFPVDNESPGMTSNECNVGADLKVKSTSIMPPGVSVPPDLEGQSWGVKRGDVQDLGLFGGAILMTIPSRLEDVSGVRQVPDHQEVFVDNASDISLIVEILNHADEVSDEEAAKYHFNDLAQCNNAVSMEITSTAIYGTNTSFLSCLPQATVKCVLTGTQKVSKFRDNCQNGIDEVLIFLIVVRMPNIQTDLLISLNMPLTSVSHGDSVSAAHAKKSADSVKLSVPTEAFLEKSTIVMGNMDSDVQFGIETFRLISSSFKIVNYSLFA